MAATNGWCPFAEHKPVPDHKYWIGNRGRDAAVMHVSEGTMESMIGWFLGGSEASAHFAIGKDGRLVQFVSVHNSAFGNGAYMRNGVWFDPGNNQIRPAWSGMRPGLNPNLYTISVEHAGFANEPWTEAMDAMNTRLLVWLADVFPSLAPYRVGRSLIGHRDISPLSRPNCPGPNVRFDRIASAVNDSIDGPVGDGEVTEHSHILHQPRGTAAQAARYILARPHENYTEGDITETILPAYWAVCDQVGVDPVVAVAQMIHETGNLCSRWSERPRRNPAGIGVTGEPGVGLSFDTWKDDAIPAHVGRLLAYAISNDTATPQQAGLISNALTWRALPERARGSAPTLRELGQSHNTSGSGWAVPGSEYGARIAAIARAIID